MKVGIKKGTLGFLFCWRAEAQLAPSHIAVSNALLIIGMFMPKLALAVALEFFGVGLTATGTASSVARSQEPFSCERATEKNRST